MTAFNMRLAVIILSAMIIEVAARCNQAQSKREGQCHFIVNCYGDIRDAMITDKACLNTYYNGLANIELTLENPEDNLIDDINDILQQQFLESVTSFKVNGGMTNNLIILNFMKNLKELNFAQNNITHLKNTTFYDMYYLEKIDLSYNQLSNVDELFSFRLTRNRLNTLLLAFNRIKQLSGLTFGELSSLVELDLSNNLISDLQEEPFLNLSKLKILRLDQNRITHLNGALNKLESLTQLYLSNNEIEHINETSLKILVDLAVFDISGNKLTEVSPILLFSRHWDHIKFTPDSDHVCKISFSNNLISNIPNAFDDNDLDSVSHTSQSEGNVCVATEVDMSNNNISNIEYNAFNSLVELTQLDLSNNELNTFCVNNTNLEFVKKLKLNSNRIKEICDQCFEFMNLLEYLDMSNNELDYFPDYVLENTENLKYLNLANNNLKRIESLYLKMFHTDGSILDLSNNGLSELNIQNGKDFVMSNMILQSNSISDLQLIDLRGLSRLYFLDLSKNSIESLVATSLNLPEYTFSLDMSHNKISSIAPGSFKRFRYLRYLNLEFNNLSELEYGIFQGLIALKTLDMSSNNIKYLDSKKLIDLKSIEVLFLRNNNLSSIDYTVWLGHKYNLTVYVDGTSLSCDWLGTALNDYNSGFSRMKLAVSKPSTSDSSLEGIACKADEVGNLRTAGSQDRLLVLVQKLLQAVNKQTMYLSNSYPMKLNPPMRFMSEKKGIKIKQGV